MAYSPICTASCRAVITGNSLLRFHRSAPGLSDFHSAVSLIECPRIRALMHRHGTERGIRSRVGHGKTSRGNRKKNAVGGEMLREKWKDRIVRVRTGQRAGARRTRREWDEKEAKRGAEPRTRRRPFHRLQTRPAIVRR
jgi:hypothetical protein